MTTFTKKIDEELLSKREVNLDMLKIRVLDPKIDFNAEERIQLLLAQLASDCKRILMFRSLYSLDVYAHISSKDHFYQTTIQCKRTDALEISIRIRNDIGREIPFLKRLFQKWKTPRTELESWNELDLSIQNRNLIIEERGTIPVDERMIEQAHIALREEAVRIDEEKRNLAF